jgi:hypothetical protein
VNVGDAVDTEKDALLERFFAFARHACAALRDQGHWADYIDPCSGLPVRHWWRLLSLSAFGAAYGAALALGFATSHVCGFRRSHTRFAHLPGIYP